MDYATLIASAVHDMKNSLGILLDTIEQMNDRCPGVCALNRKRAQMVHEAQRLNHDLLQLLSIYKFDHQHYALNIGEHPIAEFLHECALSHEALLSPHGFRIDHVCDAGLVGYFDRNLVGSVINNVINNAYKYTRDRVRLSARSTKDYLVLMVEDNGSGYPAQLLGRSLPDGAAIDFSRGSTSLGLYFSSRIAAMHKNRGRHGYIECTNEGIDGGGRFAIYLP
jgi:signal transduction histidine kinase